MMRSRYFVAALLFILMLALAAGCDGVGGDTPQTIDGGDSSGSDFNGTGGNGLDDTPTTSATEPTTDDPGGDTGDDSGSSSGGTSGNFGDDAPGSDPY